MHKAGCAAALILAGTFLALAAEPAAKIKSPLTPAQAQKEFRLPPGLRIELVASEPQIESPVAMAFDESGKLYVVEMLDYPNGPAAGQPPEGRIKVLEDKDGDGRYETASVFADRLLFANGLLPWQGGLIVTAAPHILYLKDTDGDGKADKRQVLFEGFATENPQLRVSHPLLGIDNWVYVANGLRGGKVQRPGAATPPLNISGMDFRFDPRGDRFEAVTGMGQFGNTIDNWGNRFVCTNRNHLIPIVLQSRYVQRNPYLVPPEPTRDNQQAGGAASIFPISSNFTTSSQHAGSFSAACGVMVYRGSLLPEAFRGCAFTCDPTGNLVHQEVLSFDGGGFFSRPAFQGKEFLASPDDWFRPVSLYDGPDGALYVVDMYRGVIEHPQFMTPEYKARADLGAGKHMGRIWRIVPEKHSSKPIRTNLTKAKIEELVQLLTHAHGWQRTTAQRLLLERHDPAAAKDLEKLCTAGDGKPGAVQAAYLLASQDALTPELVHALSIDRNPRVREHAAILAEPFLPRTEFLQNRIRELATDFDDRVRFQVALSLGEWDDNRILTPLARIGLQGAEDRWTRAAVATAVPKRAGALIVTLLRPERSLADKETPGRHALLHELASLVGARQEPTEIADVLDALGKLAQADAVRWQLTALNGLAEGIGRRGGQLGIVLQGLPESRRGSAKLADQLLARAAELALDAKRGANERQNAVRLLAHASWSTAEPALVKLLNEDALQEVRLAAVRALAAHPRKEVPVLLMKSWRGYTPSLRREVTEAMLRQPERILFLLDEVEAGRVRPGDIDVLRIRQLVNHGRPDIRERSKKLLSANLPVDRKEVLAKYQDALKLKADAKAGLAVFQKNCSTCHRIMGIGVDVGPSITDTLGKTPDQILTDVLNPNQAIDNNFINYVVTTKAGKVVTGIIKAETASSITLLRAENQSDAILKSDIEEIQSTGISLMPEGMEKQITVQEMADLLAFLKGWRYLEKKE